MESELKLNALKTNARQRQPQLVLDKHQMPKSQKLFDQLYSAAETGNLWVTPILQYTCHSGRFTSSCCFKKFHHSDRIILLNLRSNFRKVRRYRVLSIFKESCTQFVAMFMYYVSFRYYLMLHKLCMINYKI